MLPVKTMASKPASKQTSAAASKIKNKILNTSSFFKVSLKTNNKALALALEVQKERSRQLEREIVYLQKQVEALCFELATKKYKHRKLLLIMKNLHSNTLQHLNMVADLFPDSDLLKLPDDDHHLFGDTDKENFVVGSLPDQLPPQTEMTGALFCPLQKVTADLPEENICANVFRTQNRPKNNTDDNTDAGERQCTQPPKIETSHPSSSLRDEVERLSMMFSQSGLDMKSVLCLQNSQTPSPVSTREKPKPSLSDDAHLPSGSVMETDPEHSNKQEKTVLLNATMEMTLASPTEIVTVESKAKTTVHSGKPKGKKNKGQACQSNEAENPQVKISANSRLSDVESAPTCTLLQTNDQSLEDIRDTEVNVLQSPKTHCISVITTHILKLSKSETGNNQKRTKDKLKSHDQAKSKPGSCDSPDLDDYFKDPDLKFSKASESVSLRPEKDGAEEARSKITCRRSRTKGRRLSSVTRKNFVTLPLQLHESDSSQSIREEACNKMEEERVGTKPQRKMKSAGGSHKSRYRGTLVISVTSGSPSSNTASPEVGTTVPFNYEAKEQSTVTHAFNREYSEPNPNGHSDGHGEETQNSCKRPWLATQDSGSPQDSLICSDNHEVLPLKQGCTSGAEFQKPKKARREETSQSSKEVGVQREKWVDHLNDRKKKKKRRCSNKEFISEDKGCHLVDCIDDRKITEERLQVASHSDVGEKDGIFEHLHDSKPNELGMKCNPKHRRNASKLHTPTEFRNPRETFVVYRRKTQGNVSLNNTRTSLVAHAYSHLMDATEETVLDNPGGLLMDEMPPWLAIDVSTADTEVGSILATPRRETSCRAALIDGSAAVTTEASPAGRVLTSLTNTITTPDSETRGKSRRRNGVVSYKEPSLNSKIRRGDKFTESTFLSSPVFKDGKKKRQKKTLTNSKLERSILLD